MEALLSMYYLGREHVVAGRRERLATSLKAGSPPHQQLPLAGKTLLTMGISLQGGFRGAVWLRDGVM